MLQIIEIGFFDFAMQGGFLALIGFFYATFILPFILNLKKEKQSMFLDDAVEHLETVSDDRVKCFFADWGYGINNNHQVLSREAWKDYI